VAIFVFRKVIVKMKKRLLIMVAIVIIMIVLTPAVAFAANGNFYITFVVRDGVGAPIQGVDIDFNGDTKTTDANGEVTYPNQTGGMNLPIDVFYPNPATQVGDGHFQITYDVTYGHAIIEQPPDSGYYYTIIEFNNRVNGLIIDSKITDGDLGIEWEPTDVSYILVIPQTGESIDYSWIYIPIGLIIALGIGIVLRKTVFSKK